METLNADWLLLDESDESFLRESVLTLEKELETSAKMPYEMKRIQAKKLTAEFTTSQKKRYDYMPTSGKYGQSRNITHKKKIGKNKAEKIISPRYVEELMIAFIIRQICDLNTSLNCNIMQYTQFYRYTCDFFLLSAPFKWATFLISWISVL